MVKGTGQKRCVSGEGGQNEEAGKKTKAMSINAMVSYFNFESWRFVAASGNGAGW
jgi:hypothetical protein